jgi:hypothetical protein
MKNHDCYKNVTLSLDTEFSNCQGAYDLGRTPQEETILGVCVQFLGGNRQADFAHRHRVNGFASSNAGDCETKALSVVVREQTRHRIVSSRVNQPAPSSVEDLSGQQSRQWCEN